MAKQIKTRLAEQAGTPGGDRARAKPSNGSRDDTLDEELEAERLAPGLRTDGTGEVGADPLGSHSDGNSNT